MFFRGVSGAVDRVGVLERSENDVHDAMLSPAWVVLGVVSSCQSV